MYTLTGAKLIAHHGIGILEFYQGSVIRILEETFPEREWHGFKFSSSPHSTHILCLKFYEFVLISLIDYWKSDEVIEAYVRYLEDRLHISKENFEEDWYRVAQSQLSHVGGAQLVKMNGGLAQVRYSFLHIFKGRLMNISHLFVL